MCPYPLQRADVLTPVSGYLVVWIWRGRQGNSTPHPRWTIKRTQADRNYQNLGISGPCSTSTFFRWKALFYRFRFGLTMQKMTRYSCRIGLVNPSALPFTVRRELNSCFMSTHVIPVSSWELSPSLWLELVVMDFVLDNQSSSFTFLLTPTFLKWRI